MIGNLIAFRRAIPRLMAHAIAVSLVLLGTAVAPARGADDAGCAKVLTQVASVDLVQAPDGTLLVPIKVKGTAELFLLDPDGLSAITKTAADPLDLHETELANDWSDLSQVIDSSVSPSIDVGLVHAESMPLLLLREKLKYDSRATGVLGSSILQLFDLEVDFKALKLKLFRPDHCPGMGPYWTRSFAALPLTINPIRNNSVPMQLDGKDVRVGFHFLYPHAILSFDVAKDLFGLTPASPGMTPLPAGLRIGSANITHKYTFKALVADGLQISNPVIFLTESLGSADCRLHSGCQGSENDLSLGLAELRQLRLYFAFHEKMLYLTPAGASDVPAPTQH
jgi:hypothetical protein